MGSTCFVGEFFVTEMRAIPLQHIYIVTAVYLHLFRTENGQQFHYVEEEKNQYFFFPSKFSANLISFLFFFQTILSPIKRDVRCLFLVSSAFSDALIQ